MNRIKNTENISIYYDHVTAEQIFGNKFYFDIGFTLDYNEIVDKIENDYYEILDFKNFRNYTYFIPNKFYPNDKNKIKLTQNNQGYITLEQKYKIVWSIKNPEKFYFTDHNVIFIWVKLV